MRNERIQHQLRNLPAVPGVYLMKDAAGDVIYVGKSKNLQQRVRSYFYASHNRSKKVERLVHNVQDLELRITDTEFEALMLECQLIRELKPMYNKKMKSPHGYPYVAIRDNEGIWDLEVVDVPEAPEIRQVYGPYTASRYSVEEAVRGIREALSIACSRPRTTSIGVPCLNHSLGLCLGACLGGEAIERNNHTINRFTALLDGSDASLRVELEGRMRGAAERYDFEAAAKIRDVLNAMELLTKQEEIAGFAEQNGNIVVLERLSEREAKWFMLQRYTILHGQKVELSGKSPTSLSMEMAEEALACFSKGVYSLAGKPTRDEIDEARIIYRYLQSSECRYALIPQAWIQEADTARIAHVLEEII
ncbi:MAG: GIY-YIG nuclease family protein [Paenibacillus sp.]|uniref:GIY-YIG nuclease family protein n=1 Tax=Paenibacillus sp. TaxID=58172 RepID=UPI00291520D2|nr:GIY-YIG nuclease family protein [Paenibacillus sp.]MDU4696450.1 GIY-YIG nuclease family protein [Paenibacillus sp.]